MKRISIRFADKEHDELSALSKEMERSINDLVREAVRQYIENHHEK